MNVGPSHCVQGVHLVTNLCSCITYTFNENPFLKNQICKVNPRSGIDFH